MTEKRYYHRDYEELYYIFDSNTISEKEFDEKEEYEGYTAFEDSLSSEEIVNLLNENDELKNENQKLDEKICLHTMDLIKTKSYEQLEKELNRIKNENEGLKSENEDMRRLINNISHQRDEFHRGARENANRVGKLKKENEQLKEQNQRLSEQKHIYKQDWKHLCIDKELLDSENEELKEDNAILKHALTRLVETFDDRISDKSPVRDLIN